MNGWPLVGRDGELARLGKLVRTGTGAVVAGSAGVGKTSLARACAAEAEHAGIAVVRATATTASRSLPFGAFAALLPRTEPEPTAAVDEVLLLRRCADALVQSAHGAPLLVLVDDAHLLDNASATLVHQLAVSGAATLLLTVRTGPPPPDPVVALWKDGLVERIDLRLLTPAQIGEVLAEALDAPIDPAAAHVLADRSRGNPLFLRELLVGALEAGDLRREHDLWRLVRPLRPSSRLTELIEQRIGRLAPPEQELLRIVAVHEPIGSAELEGTSEATAVEALERKGIVASRLDGRRLQVWLAHPLYGEVARAAVTPFQHREIARRQAEIIEGLGSRRRQDMLLVATWRVVAGGGDPATLLAGAEVARACNDPALTAELASAAVEAGAGFEARFLAAEAAFLLGHADDVEAHLDVLSRLAASDSERARVATLHTDCALFLRGRFDLSQLDAAEAVVTDPAWREELLSRRLSVLWLGQGPGAAAGAAEPLLADTGPPTASYARLMGANALAVVGRLSDAAALIERTMPALVGASTAGPWYEGTRHRVVAVVRLLGGRLADAEAELLDVHERATAGGNDELRAFAASALAVVRLEQGRVRSAAVHARESAAVFGRQGRWLLAREPMIAAASAAALAGDPDAAARWIRELDDVVLAPFTDDSDVIRAAAWAAVAEGDVPRARRVLEEAAATAERGGNLFGAVAAWHDVARLDRPADAVIGLARVAPLVEGELAATCLAHAQALAARDAVGIERAATAFEELGALLRAAEAFAHASVVRRRAGEAREANAAELQAARLAAACEGAQTPALRGLDARARLAPGELDAARLAAGGLSNRAIADTLAVSVRTVENRLQRAYDKLGVSGRQGLADALESLAR